MTHLKNRHPTALAGAAGLCAALALLAGCATGPRGASEPAGPPASEADRRAAAPAALMAEQQWLQQWFSGTPVAISNDRGDQLRVDVPAKFAFDPGQVGIKPPLAAVLDRVADSLRRRELLVVAVAPPAEAEAALGRRRLEAVTRYLTSRGVEASRISASTADGAALGLRLQVNTTGGGT